MAADFLVISRSSRPQLGSQLVQAANQLRELRDRVDALNDAANHMHDAGNYAVFEAQFGLAAGQGANALTLLGLIHTILNTSGTVAGADRISQLDEFVSRVAGQ